MPPEMTRIASSPSGPEALAGKGPRGERDQRRRDAARDRVDVREVAEAIAVPKRQGIGVVHEHRADQIWPARRRRRRRQEQQRQGAQTADRIDHGEPDERIAAGFHQGVPGGVQQRRRQHQAQNDRIHRALTREVSC